MVKKNKLLIGCLTLLLVLSVGYALFSETITINGTATAKGSFELTKTCQPGMTQDAIDAIVIAEGGAAGMVTDSNFLSSGYEDGECKVNGNDISFTTMLKYPSAQRYYTVTIKNTGTIDAVIRSDVWYDPVQTIKVYDNKTNELVATYNETQSNYAGFVPFGDGTFLVGKNKNGNLSFGETMFNANSMVVKDSSGNSYVRIKPGEVLYVGVLADWDEDAEDNSHYSTAEATFTLPFTQAASDMVEVTDGEVLF